ncbi:MAG: HNH endonuclease family protein [Rhizonema sp. NSF051]|nr:HNH endonuclease family protein [Rhizonema sp. NSF051]
MKLPSEEQENIYTQDWLPLQESFKRIMANKAYADELTNAFWFYLRKDGLAVNQKEVYKNIKKHIDSSKEGVKYELQKLIQFANYYQRLNFETEEPEPKLKNSFERLRRLDFSTCHVFLLNIYHDYEEKRITLEKFVEILRYLESYFVRRLFAGISPKILGTVFNNLYGEVEKENPDDLVDGLRKVLKSYDKTKVWPDDETFRQGIINDSIYSKNLSDRTKLILEILEASLTKEKVVFDNLSVEHVMPQTLNKEWKVVLGGNHASIHKKWLHALGNLTLTGYNPELSNRSFEEKLKHFRDSNITLNKYFLKVDVWNEEAILTRANSLTDIAIKVWPR